MKCKKREQKRQWKTAFIQPLILEIHLQRNAVWVHVVPLNKEQKLFIYNMTLVTFSEMSKCNERYAQAQQRYCPLSVNASQPLSTQSSHTQLQKDKKRREVPAKRIGMLTSCHDGWTAPFSSKTWYSYRRWDLRRGNKTTKIMPVSNTVLFAAAPRKGETLSHTHSLVLLNEM